MSVKKFSKGLLFASMALFFFSCSDNSLKEITPTSSAEEAPVVSFLQNGDIIPGQYIVVFKENSTLKNSLQNLDYTSRVSMVTEKAQEVLKNNRIKEDAVLRAYGSSITGFSAKLSEAEVEMLMQDENVKYIEQDKIIALKKPSNPGGGGGGGDTGGGQETPWGITRVGGAVSGASGTAWVIDSGIDLDHPDLNVDVNRSQSFLSGGGGASSPDDQNGHGTHVAGTIAAIDNNTGVVGVAAGATVVSVRVLDRRGSGSYSGVIGGVDYVGAEGSNGDVANMSLGGGASQAIDDAVSAASSNGVKFALAAGNESNNANNSSPARVNGPNIVTISAMGVGDNWASFSNYGNPPVDYCAPGVGINSTWKGGGYNSISGTSMATPHVAGILLLGNISTDGTVNGDPDGNPDPIAVR